MPVVLTAAELLTNAAEHGGPLEIARIATLQAINRHVEAANFLAAPAPMPDGVAQSEADHFDKCPVCSQWFDMRDLAQVAEHIHDGSKIEVLEGPAPPCDPPVQ
jgi:hypothetical protein